MRFLFTLLLVAMTTPVLAATNLRELNHQVDRVVTRIKGQDKYAVEYRKARTIYFIDVDEDGVNDAIVFFTIESRMGGNNYEQYLTVLKGGPSGFSLLDTALIGGGTLGGASYERPTVEKGRIVIQRSEYADGDSRCCPSIKSNVTLVLNGSRLVGGAKHD